MFRVSHETYIHHNFFVYIVERWNDIKDVPNY